MATKKKAIWLNYDLGLKGNYSGLFRFLDKYKAIDCGDGLACFKYENNGLTLEELINTLRNELEEMVKPSSSDRIYIIWKDENKIKGKFIFGNRKAPIWNGYYTEIGGNKEDEGI